MTPKRWVAGIFRGIEKLSEEKISLGRKYSERARLENALVQNF